MMKKKTKKALMDNFNNFTQNIEGEEQIIDKLASVFAEECPADLPAAEIVKEANKRFELSEVPEILSELLLTITASCSDDDFHNWNYDHLELIIDLSNRFNFDIPRNLLNGLPEQLILTVKSDHLENPPCEDEDS